MKTLNKILSLVLLLFLSKDGALAQPDTIDGLQRYKNYYYTEWIDQCPHYDNRCYDSSSYEKYLIEYYQWRLAKTEYTPKPLKVRGLAIMNDMLTHGPCLSWEHAVEYLYLYQRTDTFNFANHGVFPPFQMILLDSVRWDTVSVPKVFSISNAPFDTVPQRCTSGRLISINQSMWSPHFVSTPRQTGTEECPILPLHCITISHLQ